MESADVTADWAWISKDLSAGIGYTVLKVSTDAIDFGAISSGYEPGAPSSTTAPDAPDAPPWVTFGPGDGGRAGVLISVSVRDPWTDTDHVGRAVWPQRLLVMPYKDLARADASFQTIWTAVRHAQVPAEDGGPLPVTVAGQSPEDLIPTIDEHFGSLAAIAAALLERPVAIADASHLPREPRLALLDAVAALLPYGYRADLSASSSVNNTVKHRIRLVFADFPKGDQQMLSLLPSEYPPLGDLGRRYLTALLEKRKRKGTGSLVRHLWDIKDEDGKRPCSFRRPGFALAALHELDYLGGIRDDLRKGPVAPEQVVRFFADPDSPPLWDRMDVSQRDNAVQSLRAAGGETAATILVSRWPVIGEDVISYANRALDAGSVEGATWSLQAVGQADGALEDRILADLLVPKRIKEDVQDRRIAMLVELLRRRKVPAPGDYPHTCGYLRFGDATEWQARLVRELLTSEMSAGTPDERVLGWVAWLCRSPFKGAPNSERPEWIHALDFMDSSQEREHAVPAVRALIQRDRQAIPLGNCWSAVFLHLSRRAGCLTDFLEGTSWQLMELAAVLPPDSQGTLGTAFRPEQGRPASVRTIQTLARTDVIGVLLGITRNTTLTDLDGGQLVAYLKALHEAFRDGVVRHRAPELERAFLGQAISVEAGPGRLTDGGIGLLNSFADEADTRDGLASYLAELSQRAQPIDVRLNQRYWVELSEYPALEDYAVAGQLITATDWTVHHPDIAFNREDLGEGVGSTRLARACYEAWCKGTVPEVIIRTLFSAGAKRIPPQRLGGVLTEFQDLVYRFGQKNRLDARKESERALFECWGVILGGMFGRDYAQHFGEYLEPLLQDRVAAGTYALETFFPQHDKSRETGKSREKRPFAGALVHVIIWPVSKVIAWPLGKVIGKRQKPAADIQPRGALGEGRHADRS